MADDMNIITDVQESTVVYPEGKTEQTMDDCMTTYFQVQHLVFSYFLQKNWKDFSKNGISIENFAAK